MTRNTVRWMYPMLALLAIACNSATQPNAAVPEHSVVATPDTLLKLTGIGQPAYSPWYNVTFDVKAMKLLNGSIAGSTVTVGPVLGAFPVIQMVGPSAAYPFWCLTFHVLRLDLSPSDDYFVNLYVEDSGDGRTAFDRVSTEFSGSPIDCATIPAPSSEPFTTIANGDFKGMTQVVFKP